jgi:hypothetical protein
MALLNYNPYTLTDTELFGLNSQVIAIQSIISTWETRVGLPAVNTLKASTTVSRTGFGGFGFGSTGSSAAILSARQKSVQLPNIILADAAAPVQAMTEIGATLKSKYAQPQLIGMTPVIRAGFGFTIPSRPIYGPPGGLPAERKAIITSMESEGTVIFKFNGQTYLYWARQYRLLQLAAESMRSSFAGVGINLAI